MPVVPERLFLLAACFWSCCSGVDCCLLLQVELWSSCQRLVFASAGRVLFGRPFFERHGEEQLLQAFLTFEGNFEVISSGARRHACPGSCHCLSDDSRTI